MQQPVKRAIIKLEIPQWGPLKGKWVLRDEVGSSVAEVRPEALPPKVRDSVRFAARSYFHAQIRGRSVSFGHRVVGDPAW